MFRRALGLTLLLGLAPMAHAQLTWVGNTRAFLYGQPFPTRAAFIEDGQTVTVTAETFPIAPGQRVVAVVSTDNFQTTREYVFTFDGNVGNNSRWYGLLGPFPSGSEVKYYIRAEGTGNAVRFDNNNNSNFGFYARWTPRYRRGAILQYFATDYRSIQARLPEIVRAGYDAIYLPPPQKSGAGGFSVGYNPVDRFDMGDRFNLGTVRTRYGTAQELRELMENAKRLGLEVYCDVVFNHNDNRAGTAISRYPDMIPEDFHIRSSADTGNNEVNFNVETSFSFGMLNHDLVGLTDIAHEDNNNTRTGAFNLPSYATFNGNGKPTFIRHPQVPQYYPTGTPASEDVRQLLKRWGWYLTNNWGFDGYRFDALKHTNPAFFDGVPDSDQPGSWSSNGDLVPFLYGLNRNLYLFGEDFTTSAFELREYGKTGINLLDFPFKFRAREVFNSGGFGNLGGFANGWGLDGATGLAFEFGGLARDVSAAMVQSHDDGPPTANNLAHAVMLGRPARPVVYYDGNNLNPFDYSQFPRPGRADSLGNYGDTTVRMLDARNRFGRGYLANRFVQNNLLVQERGQGGVATLLMGYNLRTDQAQTVTVTTAFNPGTVLTDLSGQRPNVTVGQDRRVQITIPSNGEVNNNNARGYVLYAPQTPVPTNPSRPVQLFTMSNVEIPFVAQSTPAGSFGNAGSYQVATVADDTINLRVNTDASGFAAFVRLNNGVPIGGRNPLSNTAEGLTDGFVPMTKLADGQFTLNKAVIANLPDGLHNFKVRVFRDTGTGPGLYSEFNAFFLRRKPRTIEVDGLMTGLGNWVASQSRTPSSSGNRLDLLYVNNDERNLYVGLVGTVDPAENLTNGVSMFMDTDPGSTNGVTNLTALADDSSPAARLISNTNLSAPASFRPDFAVGVFRRSQTGSANGFGWVGDSANTPVTGSFAGLFRLNAANPRVMEPRPLSAAWNPRPGPFDNPVRGLELAIPLSQIFTTASRTSTVNFVAMINTTGESGQVLLPGDANRAVFGGFGEARSWVSNQFMPPQNTVTNDPGTGVVNLSNFQSYTVRGAATATGIATNTGAMVFDALNGFYEQTYTITNTSIAFTAPLYIVATVPAGVTLVNAAGNGFLSGKPYMLAAPNGMAAGQVVRVTMRYRFPAAFAQPGYAVLRGPGVF